MNGQPSKFLKVTGAVIGNALEWYDFTVYAFMTPIISRLFFPMDPSNPNAHINALLATTAVFGVGFVMRPVGGLVLGIIGDKYGRRTGMLLGMTIMAVATVLMTFAPTYKQIGVIAPLFILVSRMMEGFSVGGEFGTSTAYLIEMAPKGKSGIYGSWQLTGQIAALAVGAGFGVYLTQCFTQAQLESGIWRVPFGFGLIIIPGAWYIRRFLQESETFINMKKQQKLNPGKSLGKDLVGHTRHLLVSIGMITASAVSFYGIFTYTVTYSKEVLHLPMADGFLAQLVGCVITVALIPVGGLLCDRFRDHRKGMLVTFLGIYFLMMYPLYAWQMVSPSLTKLIMVQTAICPVAALFLGVYTTTMSELFPARLRATGLSVANNVAVLVFGGFAQFFLTWIFKLTGSSLAPVYYVMGGLALGFIGAMLMPESKDEDLTVPVTVS
ncbi:MAG: MFS transporter [Holophaga sp.]|nr:MFS transporter [Holophaga sp.]